MTTVDLDAVDDATMFRLGWVRTRRGPIGDHCPPDGSWTLRAQTLRLVNPKYGLPDGLCRECGYPLDKSDPYPPRPGRRAVLDPAPVPPELSP